ncbi:hypothetical protein V1291_001894 [Nitrobacteraceae bacterium AZCC 1564]
MAPEQAGSTPPSEEANADRRKFLASCGKFAIVTPPAITMLLSTSLNSTAVAQSGGGGNGGGNGGGGGHDHHHHHHDWWDWFDWLWGDRPRWRR